MYAELLQEVRELRKRVEELEDKVYLKGREKKKGVPERIGIKPPWEREGMSKREWMKKKKSVS